MLNFTFSSHAPFDEEVCKKDYFLVLLLALQALTTGGLCDPVKNQCEGRMVSFLFMIADHFHGHDSMYKGDAEAFFCSMLFLLLFPAIIPDG